MYIIVGTVPTEWYCCGTTLLHFFHFCLTEVKWTNPQDGYDWDRNTILYIQDQHLFLHSIAVSLFQVGVDTYSHHFGAINESKHGEQNFSWNLFYWYFITLASNLYSFDKSRTLYLWKLQKTIHCFFMFLATTILFSIDNSMTSMSRQEALFLDELSDMLYNNSFWIKKA